jgi:hypothetical protein
MDLNTLLGLMLASYIAPIGFVYYKYKAAASCARSISSIITSCEPLFSCENNTGGGGGSDTQQQQRPALLQERHFIAACMFIMAVFTILYEIRRNLWSLALIIAVLIGIFGVIYIPETNPVHYIFAGTVFVAMIGFMIGHTLYAVCGVHDNLRILLYAQILFMVVTIIGVLDETPIFAVEALFILNFAVFYLYLHMNMPATDVIRARVTNLNI